MEKEQIKNRLQDLNVQFKRLQRQGAAAEQVVQNVTKELLKLQGAFEELNNLLPEGERLTEADFKAASEGREPSELPADEKKDEK